MIIKFIASKQLYCEKRNGPFYHLVWKLGDSATSDDAGLCSCTYYYQTGAQKFIILLSSKKLKC